MAECKTCNTIYDVLKEGEDDDYMDEKYKEITSKEEPVNLIDLGLVAVLGIAVVAVIILGALQAPQTQKT